MRCISHESPLRLERRLDRPERASGQKPGHDRAENDADENCHRHRARHERKERERRLNDGDRADVDHAAANTRSGSRDLAAVLPAENDRSVFASKRRQSLGRRLRSEHAAELAPLVLERGHRFASALAHRVVDRALHRARQQRITERRESDQQQRERRRVSDREPRPCRHQSSLYPAPRTV